MKLLALFSNHTHYWGVPHPHKTDNRLVQTCYECSAEREIKIELRPSPFQEEVPRPIHQDDIAA